jgi:hypothetical protein
MNPFTRAILKRNQDRRLKDFVRHWDALEALVIRVYKGNQASPEDDEEYCHIRQWLLEDYPRWQESLALYWHAALVAGEPASEDPFTYLMAKSNAADFVGDWRAMQNLPAAREALNEYLIRLK